jgi:hypothetical protein
MVRTLLALSLFTLSGCMPSSGPSPRAVLVIPSNQYDLPQVLEALDAVPGLGARVDKKPEFQIYETAYWYPRGGSDTYGVAVVRWASDLKGDGSEDMTNRYFVDVYAKEEACPLCASVKATLKGRNIKFVAACENPKKSTAYERIRCGT